MKQLPNNRHSCFFNNNLTCGNKKGAAWLIICCIHEWLYCYHDIKKHTFRHCNLESTLAWLDVSIIFTAIVWQYLCDSMLSQSIMGLWKLAESRVAVCLIFAAVKASIFIWS